MKKILNEKEIARSLRRITHEIIEKNDGVDHLIFAGIKTRGVPIAQRIIQNIQQMEDIKLELIPLDITEYRDDRDVVVNQEKLEALHHRIYEITGKTVIIVDDVMYTGRSARAAMEAILKIGRPSRIQLCTLIDRGHRELPVKADYVGKNIPTSRNEKVFVYLEDTDGKEYVGIA